jgi:hypothetical protein
MLLKLRLVLESGSIILLLGALLFLLIRYVEQQRSPHEVAKLALLMVAPALLLTLFDLALPLVAPRGGLLSLYLDLRAIAVPVLVFLLIWKSAGMTPKRAVFYTAGYLILGFVADIVYTTLRPLFPPYSGYRQDRQITQSLIQLGFLLIPVIGWAAARALKFKISPLVGGFGLALVFAPTVIIGHGAVMPIPALLAWVVLFVGGIRSEEGMLLLFSLVLSVGLWTVLFYAGFRIVQRFRISDSGVGENASIPESSE